MSDRVELISFKLCPFVQRSVILLLEKKVEFKLTHIDLQNKPDWFLEISPTGKVPILKVNEHVLFESSVINEYLDEKYLPSLHPDDLIIKAEHRAWIEFSSTLFFDMMGFLSAKSEQVLSEKRDVFFKKLSQLEQKIEGDFFGNRFALVDIAFAPIFLRLSFVQKKVELLRDFSKLQQWQNSLLSRSSVQQSYVPELESMFINRLISQESLLLNSDKKE